MVTSIMQIVLGILGIVGFLWMMIGSFVGTIWVVAYLVGDKKKKFPVLKWAVVTFGGMVLLPIVFGAYAIITLGREIYYPVYPPEIVFPTPTMSSSFDATWLGSVCKTDTVCGDIVGVNCNQEVDGPYYFVNKQTREILATCGGACMGGGADCQTKCVEYANLCK